MALISEAVFTGYADRLAAQYALLKTALASMSGGTAYYTRLTATDDPDVEIPMLDTADVADDYIAASDAAETMIRAIPSITALFTAIDNHLTRVGQSGVTTWDTLCTELDCRMSMNTNKMHYAKYRRNMLARNVFSETPITMASCAVDTIPGSTSGALEIDFTIGANFGDGGATRTADGTHYAGQLLKAVVGAAPIASALRITITGKNELGATVTVSPAVDIIGIAGAEITLGTARWVSVTNVELASGGTDGDEFTLVSIKERTAAL